MALDNDYLHRLHDAANRGFGSIDLAPVATDRLIALVTLYATIIELTHGVGVLTEFRSFSSLPSVLRSLIEAHVEFLNLARDPEYLKVHRFLDQRQTVAMLKASRQWLPVDDGYSPAATAIAIERLECEMRAAKADGLAVPDIKERFGRAGMDALYATGYVSLCSLVHVNKTALALGHHERDGQRLTVFVHDEPAPEIMRSYFTLAAGVLRESSVVIYHILDVALPDELCRLMEEVNLRPLAAFGGPNKRINLTRRARQALRAVSCRRAGYAQVR